MAQKSEKMLEMAKKEVKKTNYEKHNKNVCKICSL